MQGFEVIRGELRRFQSEALNFQDSILFFFLKFCEVFRKTIFQNTNVKVIFLEGNFEIFLKSWDFLKLWAYVKDFYQSALSQRNAFRRSPESYLKHCQTSIMEKEIFFIALNMLLVMESFQPLLDSLWRYLVDTN